MVDSQRIGKCIVFREMNDEDRSFWFEQKTKKFLHNTDTFYYSVKLQEDFTHESRDKNVLAFRRCYDTFNKKILKNQFSNDTLQFFVPAKNDFLNVEPGVFARYYSFRLLLPEEFDIFIAPFVPGTHQDCVTDSVTSEIIVQIRSNLLWSLGIHAAFERSFSWVKGIIDMYGFHIQEVKENRTDFCYHSNYLDHPEDFFSKDSFEKMCHTRLGDGTKYIYKDDGTRKDKFAYLCRGRRGDKTFLRIYNKSMEVVEQGYKAFFLKTWLFHGLINRYDFDIMERCYLKQSWKYETVARIKWYLQHGENEYYKDLCKQQIAVYEKAAKITPKMIELCDRLTPPVTTIINVEFQLMRKGSKSYDLLSLKDNSSKGSCRRIYDFLDNRRLITDYLTSKIFRMVEKVGDENKSRRPNCGFWKALRHTKMVDCAKLPEGLKIHRLYSRELNAEKMKKSIIHKAVTYGIYNKGINDDSPVSDIMLSILKLNDNDIHEAEVYKRRRSKQFNQEALLQALPEQITQYNFSMMDVNTGEIIEKAELIKAYEEEKKKKQEARQKKFSGAPPEPDIKHPDAEGVSDCAASKCG